MKWIDGLRQFNYLIVYCKELLSNLRVDEMKGIRKIWKKICY